MITVFHFSNDYVSSPWSEDEVRNGLTNGWYKFVAKVDGDDLENAYALTQNIEDSWTKNAGVSTILDRCRSSMVGDILVKDGDMFWVARIGFEPLYT
jgi:hypothetical protein